MFESNLANLTAQYQQAYLVYYYKIIYQLHVLAWLAEQKVSEKSASRVKKLANNSLQQNPQLKPLKHKEKSQVSTMCTSDAFIYADDLVSQTNSTGTYYYQYDGLGSTRQLTNQAGNVTDSYHYDAFGNLLSQTGTTDNNYLYTGEQFDPNMGFYYLRARYMNPENGRFTQMDTFAGRMHEPVTLHKYLYANANPSNMIDPSGNFGIGSLGTAQRVMGIISRYATSRLFSAVGSSAVRNTGLAALASIGGGYAGYQLYAMLSGIPISAALEAEESEDAGGVYAQLQTDALVGEPKGGVTGRRAAIGENQRGRVIPAAIALKAITIVFDKNHDFKRPLSAKNQLLSIAYNVGWIQAIKFNNFEIYDIGRDPARFGAPISPWYAAELASLRGYPKHFRIKWP